MVKTTKIGTEIILNIKIILIRSLKNRKAEKCKGRNIVLKSTSIKIMPIDMRNTDNT